MGSRNPYWLKKYQFKKGHKAVRRGAGRHRRHRKGKGFLDKIKSGISWAKDNAELLKKGFDLGQKGYAKYGHHLKKFTGGKSRRHRRHRRGHGPFHV